MLLLLNVVLACYYHSHLEVMGSKLQCTSALELLSCTHFSSFYITDFLHTQLKYLQLQLFTLKCFKHFLTYILIFPTLLINSTFMSNVGNISISVIQNILFSVIIFHFIHNKLPTV